MNSIKKFVCIFLFAPLVVFGQGLNLVSEEDKNFAEKLTVLFPNDFPYASSIRSFNAEAVKEVALTHYQELSEGDKMHFKKLANQFDHKKFDFGQGQNKEKVDKYFYRYTSDSSSLGENFYNKQRPLLKYFYNSPYHFLSVDAKGFVLRANPIVQLSYGNASNHTDKVIQNTRGAELTAYIDDKVYIYTRILENQQSFLPYVNQYVEAYRAIPQNGLYKAYNSSILSSFKGYDFLNAQAHVGVPITKSISIEFGHGRHFIGNGLRSLLLSDFSNNYLYLKFNTKVWKLHYQNIFAELNSFGANTIAGDELIPKKYMANHYLSIKPFNNAEIGVFESVIFARENQFELQYLNPLIFYRLAEHFVGSPDNLLVGLNANYSLKNRAMIYGQLLLDEFNLGLFKQDGWWGNKFGYQLGLKYYNCFNIDQLDVQLEFNQVRPYTYSHNVALVSNPSYVVTSYTHYNMPLAHPLGANFREYWLKLKYGKEKLKLEFDFCGMTTGRDDINNYGSDPRINNTTRISDFGNAMLQGVKNDVMFLRLNASYEIFTNYKIFIQPQYRNSTSNDVNYNYQNLYLGGGLSINLDLDKNIY